MLFTVEAVVEAVIATIAVLAAVTVAGPGVVNDLVDSKQSKAHLIYN
jgi:hypothetical protein